MTNLVEVFTGLDNSKAVALYQALQFTASRPILDINSSPGGMVSLVLYGTPLAAYQVDYVPTLNFPLDWTLLREIPLTNSFQMINLVASGSGSGFYRVGTSNAEPPILDGQLANPYRPLLVHGLAGTNYTLQYATNLSTGVIWYPLLNVTLTNSFQ